jgi:hypothetical protein
MIRFPFVVTATMTALAAALVSGVAPAAAQDASPPEFSVGRQSIFVAPLAASRIVLPGSADGTPGTQDALLKRAEDERRASAEVRRKAEELSRRFVGDGTAATVAADAPSPAAAPPSADPSAGAPASAAAPDPLDDARRLLAEAEARAASERVLRLAAEAEARMAIEKAAAAMAKSKREADAASRRAAEAEQRAVKATVEAHRKSASQPSNFVARDRAAAKPALTPGPAAGVASGSLKAQPAVAAKAQPVRSEPPPPPFALGILPTFGK